MKKLIYHKKKFILIPENAEELSGKQLIAIAGLLHSEYTTLLKASLLALRILGNISCWKFLRVSNEVKLRCLPHVQWIFDKITITKNLIPEYKNFYGPDEELNNLTIAEFHFAEKYYAEIKGEDYAALPHLIATIYRKAKPGYNEVLNKDGDVRQKFNSNVVDYYARKIARWPDAVKFAVLIFYDSCRNKIADENPNIFGSGGEDDGLGMYSVIRGLAGPKFGDIEKVEEMLLQNALTELNLIHEEDEELKRKYNK